MKLFDMTEADLDREYQRQSDRMYDEYYGLNRPEPSCSWCDYYLCGDCCYGEEDKPTEPDEYCNHFRAREDY